MPTCLEDYLAALLFFLYSTNHGVHTNIAQHNVTVCVVKEKTYKGY